MADIKSNYGNVLIGSGFVGFDLGWQKKRYATFDAEFRPGPPVYDKGISKSPLICDRDNIQPDGSGGSVAVDTPVIDRQYGLRTNGGYTVRNTYSNDFTQWSISIAGSGLAPIVTPNYDATPDGFTASRLQCNLNGGLGGSQSQIRLSITLLSSVQNVAVFGKTNNGQTHYMTLDLGSSGAVEIGPEWSKLNRKAALPPVATQIRIGLVGGLTPAQPDTCDISIAVCNVIDGLAYPMPSVITTTAPITVGTNYSYDDAGTQKGPHWQLKSGGQVIPAMQWLWDILNGPAAVGKIQDTWRPGFPVADVANSTTINIWSPDGNPAHGLYAYKDGAGNGSMILSDGTNSVSVPLAWAADTDYQWKTVFDTDEMQLQVNALVSAISTFAGTFSPGDNLSFAEDTIQPQWPARHIQAKNYVVPTDWETPT